MRIICAKMQEPDNLTLGTKDDTIRKMEPGGGKVHILICDDELDALDVLRMHTERYMNEHQIRYTLTAITDPSELYRIDTAFDLAILDIQIGPTDGIRLAGELRHRNPRLALFFVTNYDEYQDDAMDLQAFRFLPKPLDPKRLYSGLDKAMEYIDGAYVEVFLTDRGTSQRVLADDILYITRRGRRIVVVTGEEEFSITESMDDFCRRLPQRFFYPVHKSFYVNLHYVQKYSYSELLLTNGVSIPIAPRRQSAFHKFWFDYLRRR